MEPWGHLWCISGAFWYQKAPQKEAWEVPKRYFSEKGAFFHIKTCMISMILPRKSIHFGYQNGAEIDDGVDFHSWRLFFLPWGGLLASLEALGIDLGRIWVKFVENGGPKESQNE